MRASARAPRTPGRKGPPTLLLSQCQAAAHPYIDARVAVSCDQRLAGYLDDVTVFKIAACLSGVQLASQGRSLESYECRHELAF